MRKSLLYSLTILSIFIFPFVINAKEITNDFVLTEDINDGIVVKSGSNIVVDLAGFNIKNEVGNHTIKIEKDAILTIKGNGNVSNVSNSKAPIYNEGKVTIESGTYSRVDSKGNSYYVILNHGDMIINGGTFQVTNGISSLIDNGWYTPSQNIDKEMSTLVINDGNFLMTNNDKYIKNDDYGIMTINGGTFTMEKPSSAIIANVGSASGNETVTISGGNFNYTGSNYAIWGYAGTTNINGGNFKLSNNLAKVSNVELSKKNNVYKVIGKEDEYIVVNENDLIEKVETTDIKEEDVPTQEIELVKDAIDNKYIIVAYYNIDLYKFTSDKIKVEQLTESDNEITITVRIPSNLNSVATGYKRSYYIIRVHDGITDILSAIDNGDGTISFKTDKFSTYSLVYKDTKVVSQNVNNSNKTLLIENPETYDGVLVYSLLGFVSFIVLVGTGIYFKRKIN